MRYLVSSSSSFLGYPDTLGVMIGPRQRGYRPLDEGRFWAGDNDAYHGKFTEQIFLAHLARLSKYKHQCLFVNSPDVMQNPEETQKLFTEWGGRIRDLGFPAAWVAQDGATPSDIPDCDAVFIGGSTDWKLGECARVIADEAKNRKLYLHVGRVNSLKRSLLCADMGADSVDGTYTSFRGKERGMADIVRWMEAANNRRKL